MLCFLGLFRRPQRRAYFLAVQAAGEETHEQPAEREHREQASAQRAQHGACVFPSDDGGKDFPMEQEHE